MEKAELNNENFKVLCAHVVNGGSVLDICEMWGQTWEKVWSWIQEDRERAVMYDKAVAAQNEWAIVRVLKELRAMALSDLREMYDAKGKLKHPKDWPDHVARAVVSVDVFEEFEGVGKERELVGYTKRVKMADKLKALEMIGKHLRMFIDRVEHNGVMTLEDLVDSSNDGRARGRLPGVEANN